MKIHVTFDGKQFEIYCDYAGNIKARNIPQRDFRKTPTPHWVCKPLKGNARYIDTTLRIQPGFSITPEAAGKVSELLSENPFELGVVWPMGYEWKMQPFDKQRWAINQIYNLRCWALFAEMRCGKSKISLDVASAHYMRGAIQGVIAISKVSLVDNWITEAHKHVPDSLGIQTFAVDSTNPRLMRELVAPKTGFFLVSVGVESLSVKLHGGKAFDAINEITQKYKCMIIVDEAHHVKNMGTAKRPCLRTNNVDTLSKQCDVRAILTGTPTPKNILDLYSQFFILDPDIIGHYSYYTFKNRYAIYGGYEDKQIIGFNHEDELMDKIRPFTVRFERKDTFSVPDPEYQVRRLDMPKELAVEYRKMKNERELVVDGENINVTNTIGAYTKLRQMANGFVYDNDKLAHWLVKNHPKVEEVIDIIEGTDEQIIVWVNNHGEVEVLAKAFKNINFAMYHGKNKDVRQQEMDDFKAGKKQVLLASISAANTGHDLYMASVEIFFSSPLSYTDRKQAEDRTQGPDQKNSAMIIDLVMRGTIEETILAANAVKKDTLEFVLDSMKKNH